ncbi:MAG: sugar transferase [Balneolaceae bacterium]
MIKRIVDVIIVLVGLMLLWPLLIILALINYFMHGSPVLFKQVRPGKNGEPFMFYKFRTMTNERDQTGELLPDAERLTPYGEWLRKTSLDELPSLFNVLKGEMSLVGPRPLLMEYVPLYNTFQQRRHEVKPGITGWAQVNGRNEISWERKFELDVWYVENQSLGLDLKVLFLTLNAIIRRKGINAKNHKTMPKFRGSIDKN